MMGPVLCLVTDRQRWGQQWRSGLVGQVRAAALAGVSLIQVREPGLDGGELRGLVAACVDVVRGTRTRVVVNERLDVAIAAGAHGVHLRGDSLPASRVRGLRARPFLIGRSIHTVEEAQHADAAALDYLVFGTVFATASKPGRAPAGVEALAAVVQATSLPVLAVGGIMPDTMAGVMAAGAAGAAAIGLFAGDVASVVQQITGAQVPIDTLSGRSLP